MVDNRQIATDILSVVGGKENIKTATHCMTRLRLNLKDESVIDVEEAKKVNGVLGYVKKGGQNQFIIGQNVDKVYGEFCKAAGVAMEEGGEDSSEQTKQREKLTAKQIGSNILNYLAGALTPLIPLIIAAAMFRTVQVIIGPDMLGWISAESDLYLLLDFLYEAGFYFFPIYLGYTASKKLGASPVLGMLMGGILIAPGFLDIVASGESFTVYGIPCVTGDYSQTVIPIILSVWVMSYIERFMNKVIPTALRTIFAPFLTIAIMVPISLCVLAPAGNVLGVGIGNLLVAFGGVGGFLAVAVIAALWEYLVMSGMHLILAMVMITTIMQQGYEGLISPAAFCATFAAIGMALGAAIKTTDKQERSMGIGYFVSGVLGGVTEPALYGIGFKYKRPLIGMSIGAFIGGIYAGITHVKVYVVGATNILCLLGLVGGGTWNLVNGTIALFLSLFAAAIATYIIGLEKKMPTKSKVEAVDIVPYTKGEILAPIKGRYIPLKEIGDGVFSEGILGQGCGIVPSEGVLYAPVDGKISSIADTKHAIGITTEDGGEFLVHVGMDTVEMNGDGFHVCIAMDEEVKAGQKLLEFDLDKIKAANHPTTTAFVLTNSSDFSQVDFKELKLLDDKMVVGKYAK